MSAIVVDCDAVVGPWVASRSGGSWSPGRGKTIGLSEQGTLLAGVIYEDFNGANVSVHIAAVSGKAWASREFLWFIHYYPFEQLGAKRLTAVVASSNEISLTFCHKLGFVTEATLKDAHPDGDLLILRMKKEDCRWLTIRRPQNGKIQRT